VWLSGVKLFEVDSDHMSGILSPEENWSVWCCSSDCQDSLHVGVLLRFVSEVECPSVDGDVSSIRGIIQPLPMGWHWRLHGSRMTSSFVNNEVLAQIVAVQDVSIELVLLPELESFNSLSMGLIYCPVSIARHECLVVHRHVEESMSFKSLLNLWSLLCSDTEDQTEQQN